MDWISARPFSAWLAPHWLIGFHRCRNWLQAGPFRAHLSVCGYCQCQLIIDSLSTSTHDSDSSDSFNMQHATCQFTACRFGMGLPVRSPVWPCQGPGVAQRGTARHLSCCGVASRSRSLGDGAARALGVTAVPVAGGRDTRATPVQGWLFFRGD